MNDTNQKQLGNTLWSIADQLRGAMDSDDFRDYMLSFLFLRYLSDNYETAAKKDLGRDYPDVGGDARKVPLALLYANNVDDIPEFEKQMRRKVHYVIQPAHLWNSVANLPRTQNAELTELSKLLLLLVGPAQQFLFADLHRFPQIVRVSRAVEECVEPVVVRVTDRIVLVRMTLSTADRESQPDRARGVHAINHRFIAKLIRLDSTLLVDHRVAMKARGNPLRQRW